MNLRIVEDSTTNEGVGNSSRNATIRGQSPGSVKQPVIDKDVCTLLWDTLQGFQGTLHGLDNLLHSQYVCSRVLCSNMNNDGTSEPAKLDP